MGRFGRDSYREPRRRKLSPEQAAAIRANAGNRSLRELAAEFGVSHETVRAVLRERGGAPTTRNRSAPKPSGARMRCPLPTVAD